MFTLVDYKYKDLYWKSHIDKQIKIIVVDFVGYGRPSYELTEGNYAKYLGAKYLDVEKNEYYVLKNLSPYQIGWDLIKSESELTIFKNSDIEWENFELSESLCSESELRFGSCETSSLKIKIHNNFLPLKDKWMLVSETLEGNIDAPFQFGRYKVFSDVPTADRKYRNVTAYDSMYDILNANVIDWYNSVLPNNNSRISMQQFRVSFFKHFGIREVLPVLSQENGVNVLGLVNDDVILERTIEVWEGEEVDNEEGKISIIKESSLSGKDVINAICEINGCFGHIGRDGKFHYIYLNQDIMGLYPSKTLFPDHAPDYLPQAETGHLYPQSPKSTRIGNGTYISADYEDFICRKINKVQIREKENDVGGQFPEEKLENENAYIIEDNFLVYGKSAADIGKIAENILEKVKDIVYRPFSAECVGNPCLEVGDPVRLSTRYELIESYILQRTLKGIQDLRDSYSAEGEEMRSEKVNSISGSIIQLKGKTNTLERNAEKTLSKIEDVENDTNTRFEQTADAIEAEASARDKLGNEVKASLSLKIDKDDDGTVISLINGSADKIHFGANNMFTVDSPNFSIDENGNIRISGNVIANENFSLTYMDSTTRPITKVPYVFVATDYNKQSENPGVYQGDEPYLIIKSPRGKEVMEIGNLNYSQDGNKFKMMDTPYFPNGAMIENAYISSLQQTYRFSDEIGEIQDEGGGKPVQNCWIDIRVRKSGAFTTVYGVYHVYNHGAGAFKEIKIGSSTELSDLFIPEYENVRTVGVLGRRPFIFVLTTDGRFTARNSSDLDVSSDTEISSIKFRFDFFKWN